MFLFFIAAPDFSSQYFHKRRLVLHLEYRRIFVTVHHTWMNNCPERIDCHSSFIYRWFVSALQTRTVERFAFFPLTWILREKWNICWSWIKYLFICTLLSMWLMVIKAVDQFWSIPVALINIYIQKWSDSNITVRGSIAVLTPNDLAINPCKEVFSTLF